MLVLSFETGDLFCSIATEVFQPAALWFVAPSYLFVIGTGADVFGTLWVVFDSSSQAAVQQFAFRNLGKHRVGSGSLTR